MLSRRLLVHSRPIMWVLYRRPTVWYLNFRRLHHVDSCRLRNRWPTHQLTAQDCTAWYSSKPSPHPEKDYAVNGYAMNRSNVKTAVGAVAGGAALVVAIPVAAAAAGFGAGGIAAGSVAASMMSTAATTGVGAGAVAFLQSVGAVGLSASATTITGAVGAFAGGLLGKAAGSAKSGDETETKPGEPDERYLKVHRSLMEQDMINYFCDPSIIRAELEFHFIDERGVDANGLSREAYSSFWQAFMEQSARGEAERIPMIQPRFQKAEWEAIGRILVKGFLDHGVFPIQLSKVFVIALLFGEQAVSIDDLFESFKHYLTPPEARAVEKAWAGTLDDDDDEDRDEFLDVLSSMGSHSVPKNVDDTRLLLLDIAQKQLIQEGKYALDAMASVARDPLRMKLPDVQSVQKLYKEKTPSTRKVIGLLKPQESGPEQEKTFRYLKQFVKGLDDATLKKFLRHVTGAEVICVEKIEVHFNESSGFGRAPVVHTCVPMIELPTTYGSPVELKLEFSKILAEHTLPISIG